MRNEPKPLSPLDESLQRIRQADLSRRNGKVTVTYIKRDGTESSSTGTVSYFNGKPGFDTGSVTIDTEDKGPRTINLHRITRIHQ